MSRGYPVVLLVDDHEDTVAMYAYVLLAMGFQPVTAGSPDDGFERACRLQPDVVVADFTSPAGPALNAHGGSARTRERERPASSC